MRRWWWSVGNSCGRTVSWIGGRINFKRIFWKPEYLPRGICGRKDLNAETESLVPTFGQLFLSMSALSMSFFGVDLTLTCGCWGITLRSVFSISRMFIIFNILYNPHGSITRDLRQCDTRQRDLRQSIQHAHRLYIVNIHRSRTANNYASHYHGSASYRRIATALPRQSCCS